MSSAHLLAAVLFLAPAASVSTPTTTPRTSVKQAQPERPKGKIVLKAKIGPVTFDHEKHAGKLTIPCVNCHHKSQPQKPLASEHQACRDCHTMPATPPLKTSLQAAFHDPKAAKGSCIDCHKQKRGLAPVKCLECHKKK